MGHLLTHLYFVSVPLSGLVSVNGKEYQFLIEDYQRVSVPLSGLVSVNDVNKLIDGHVTFWFPSPYRG